jgi:hypothetical protein
MVTSLNPMAADLFSGAPLLTQSASAQGPVPEPIHLVFAEEIRKEDGVFRYWLCIKIIFGEEGEVDVEWNFRWTWEEH